MPKAILVQQTGGPEVLKLADIPAPRKPGRGQVLVRHKAIGVNFMDIYFRRGWYKAPRMPFIPGMEACGVVEAVGAGVEVKVGQRVAYATAQTGAYCERRLINVHHLVGVPDQISDEVAAASLVKGMTAHYLLFRTFAVKRRDTLLIHAAAGGVGQVLCQWAKRLGATVIGTVGSKEKVRIAKSCGCDHVIVYTEEDFVAKVKEYTKGEGVAVAYDSVGKATFKKSLAALRPLGLLVSYGQSSGMVPSFNVLSLASKSNFITRPTLALYKSERLEMVLTAVEIFKQITEGHLNINIGNRYNFEDAARAHTEMEKRQTTGSNILLF